MLSKEGHLHDAHLIYKVLKAVFKPIEEDFGFREVVSDIDNAPIRTTFRKNKVKFVVFISRREALDLKIENEFGDTFGMISCVNKVYEKWSDESKSYYQRRKENVVRFEKHSYEYYEAFIKWDLDFILEHFPSTFHDGHFPLQHEQNLRRFLRLESQVNMHSVRVGRNVIQHLYIDKTISLDQLSELVDLIWKSGYNFKFSDPRFRLGKMEEPLFFYSSQGREECTAWSLVIYAAPKIEGIYIIESELVKHQIHSLVSSGILKSISLDEDKIDEDLKFQGNHPNNSISNIISQNTGNQLDETYPRTSKARSLFSRIFK